MEMRMARLGRFLALAWAVFMSTSVAMPLRAESAPTNSGELNIAGPVLIVTDLERSLRFYTEGLGLVVASRLPGNPGPGATVVAPGSGRVPFVLLRQREATPKSAPPVEMGAGLSRIMLSVSDAKAIEARLTSAGYTAGPIKSKNIFFVKDPDGYSYEIIQTQQAR
jgi:lactoylglutathione lyase